MMGDQGDVVPSPVSVPMTSRIERAASTEPGRRSQLFSPVPDRKGSAKRKPIATTGPTRRMKVSVHGGRSAKRAKSHKKKKLGRGAVSTTVGSGKPRGPWGPKSAAHAKTA